MGYVEGLFIGWEQTKNKTVYWGPTEKPLALCYYALVMLIGTLGKPPAQYHPYTCHCTCSTNHHR